MKNHVLSLAALSGVILLGIWEATHRPLKIGYAETAVLMSSFSDAVKAKGEFETAQADWNKNLKSLNDSVIAAMNVMKAEYDGAKEARKKELSAKLETRQEDYRRYVEAVRKMSQEREQQLMDPVIKKINSFLDTWGNQHGYTLILGATTGGNILQANQSINLTSQILKDLNDTYRDLPSSKEKAKDSATSVNGAKAK